MPREMDAETTVTRYATAWARPDLPADQWWSQVHIWCTHEYAPLLRSTTQADIPAKRVTGTPTLAQRQGDELSYAVPTDAGTLTVTVVVQDGQWKVRRSGLRTPGASTDPDAPQPKPKANG